jgi:O-antigen/teichoic acid export membrane protein
VSRSISPRPDPLGLRRAPTSGTPAIDAEPATEPRAKPLPPVLGKLLSGTFWLALRTPLSAGLAFWTVPLMLGTFGKGPFGAYNFAWSFGFFQLLLEFGMSSALQREIAERWTRDDRRGVDRAVTCGLLFYAVTAVAQAGVLLGIAYFGLSQTSFRPGELNLITQLLWLQALTAPFYGLTVVVSGLLQAARRFDVIPRFELAIVALRFLILLAGVKLGASLLAIVGVQTLVQIGLGLGPAAWVVRREIGYIYRPLRVSFRDFRGLMHISLYMFLMHLSVAMADKVDRAILGFALPDPDEAVSVYSTVMKPFEQVRQMGWTLAFLVMPAVASLAAADDREGLDRVKYDGARLHAGAIFPVGLLAWLLAAPFLDLWVGAEFAGQVPELAALMRLFLVATLPLLVAVHVQVAIGMGRIAFISWAAMAGAAVNLPLSYFLTLKLGVAGVIWGTVLTTLVSNLLLPGWYAFRVTGVSLPEYWRRTLAAPVAGGLALVAAVLLLGAIWPAWPLPPGGFVMRALPFASHLAIGMLAYAAGYLAVPAGRSDYRLIARRFSRRGAEA